MGKKLKYTVRKGEVYGDLTVLEEAGVAGNGHRMWLCRCKCGSNCLASAVTLCCGSKTKCDRCRMEAIYERRRRRREAHSMKITEKAEREKMKQWPPVDKSKFNDDWMFESLKQQYFYDEKKKAEKAKKRKQYYNDTGK